MGCGGSKGSLVATQVKPYRGVSFEGSSFSMKPEMPVKDRRDPERRRAKLMASQKKSAKLYKSQSWASPSKRAPAGHRLMTAQQLRDKGTQRGLGLSKSWSSPGHPARQPNASPRRRPKNGSGLKIDLPLNSCGGELGNFWGTSPHSPQALELINAEDEKQNALIGQAHSPISPVSIIYAKKAAKHLRRAANERTKLTAKEKAKRKKEKLQKEREFMESMFNQADKDTDEDPAHNDEANIVETSRQTSRSPKRVSLKRGVAVGTGSKAKGGG